MFHSISKELDSGVIFETDFCGDVDDVGALAVLCRREIEYNVPLLGVSVNVNRPFIVPAVDSILSFLGHKQIPMTMCEREEERKSPYLEYLAEKLPADRATTLKTESVVDFYRNILEKAPDHSVCIISVGFFCNMNEALLAMPELFARKIRCVYMMAGCFTPGSTYVGYNINQKLESALQFLRTCPCQMVFVPHETGIKSLTDFRGLEGLTDNPIVMAYKIYTNNSMLRPSWDPITVDFAFSGENENYALSEEGELIVQDNGNTALNTKKAGNVYYLMFKKTDDEIGVHITREIKNASNCELA